MPRPTDGAGGDGPDDATAPVVVLKLDDLAPAEETGGIPPAWQAVDRLLRERDVAAAYGVIGKWLRDPGPEFVEWCRDRWATERVELFNHGFTHGYRAATGQEVAEFGDARPEQSESLARTQRLATRRLGRAFRTFGAPFNTVTADTAAVLAEDPDMAVWLYGDRAAAERAGFDGLLLDRDLNIEQPTSEPNADAFLGDLSRRDHLPDVCCLQGHPPAWDQQLRAEFERILDALVERGCRFATPLQYARACGVVPTEQA